MDTLDRKSVRRFFGTLCDTFPLPAGTTTVVVTHLLPDRPFFLEAIDRLSPICMLVPKPKSAYPNVKDWIKHRYPLEMLSREELGDPERTLTLIKRYAKDRPLIILDIGGYFAMSANFIAEKYAPGLVGIVEDTENGHQRYAKLENCPCPIISVARSPLKDVEDFLVGESIVFSVEALLREQGDVFQGRTACVIGYGKIGRSIAALLHARHVRTIVYDRDVIRQVQAMSHGFFTTQDLSEALLGAGLVFCATGNFSITAERFPDLTSGAYVATVTSSDDELQLSGLRQRYHARHVSEFVTRYDDDRGRHHFFLLNRGQAVNFIHGAAVGPFIYLVQGELLASISDLFTVESKRMLEASHNTRSKVARAWCDAYGVASSVGLKARSA